MIFFFLKTEYKARRAEDVIIFSQDRIHARGAYDVIFLSQDVS